MLKKLKLVAFLTNLFLHQEGLIINAHRVSCVTFTNQKQECEEESSQETKSKSVFIKRSMVTFFLKQVCPALKLLKFLRLQTSKLPKSS